VEYGFASWDRLKAHVEGGAAAPAALDFSAVKLAGNQCRGEVVITDREWDWTFHHNGWFGWGILTDARADGTILGACLNGRTDNPADYPGLCRALSRGEPTLDEGEAHVEVLRRAVDRIRGQGDFARQDTRMSGLEAVDAWIGVMETDVGFCAECQQRSGNGWSDAVDVARYVAGGADTVRRFLRRAAETFPVDAQPHVEAAAGRYARIADLLAPALDGEEAQRYKAFVGDLAAQKAHADTALRPVQRQLATAADDMERALAAMA